MRKMVTSLGLAVFTEEQHPATVYQLILFPKVGKNRGNSCVMFMANPQFFLKLLSGHRGLSRKELYMRETGKLKQLAVVGFIHFINVYCYVFHGLKRCVGHWEVYTDTPRIW